MQSRATRGVAASVSPLLLLLAACVAAPRPTREALLRERNPRAIVEGVVRDEAGRPVAGIQVIGLPRDRDLTWSDAASTDAAGAFHLALVAPGDYAFLLSWKGVSVVTKNPGDPARLRIHLEPGAVRPGIELTWLREEWEATLAESGQALPPPP